MSSLDEIAAELYDELPESFIGKRDEYVKQAKAAGDRDLAREIGKLRRPTQSAWLVNRLARDESTALDELLGLGEEYAAALAGRDGTRLKELTAHRRDLEARLVARAREIGAEAGVAASEETLGEVRGTLDAMISDADVAGQVRAGRLVKTASASLGGVPPRATPTRKPSGKPTGKASSPQSRQAPAGDRARETEDAAREARARAATELAERTSEAERANTEYEQLSERLEQLRADVQALAQDVRVAEQNAARAERRRANAERRLNKLDAG